MTSDRWQQIEELFHAAVEIPEAERQRFLKRSCGDDAELGREVESLLDAYHDSPDFLEEPAARITEGGISPDIDRMEGKPVGHYRIISRIGEGGMGAVYLAERDDEQYRQQVAIKLVKRGMDSEEILRRFRSERQILASLDHPNIARLFDGGITDDGRPYVVMEYIEEATAIDSYCDLQQLNVIDRLRIFRVVASAVHYAHQNLVVHRDLKMSNILVSRQGRVKLLDFGIAKILNPDLPAEMLMTRTEMRLMTPEYASPEQVRGETITTASDIYALGVLLYELLTGHPPYQLKNRSVTEIERVICEEEPACPSEVIMHTAQIPAPGGTHEVTPQIVSAARDTGIERLRRQLRGDLDNIILMAMQKEPSRRYRSVEQMSEDLLRFLEGMPVIAQKDRVGYRMGKFIRRHKIGVAAASALFTSITGFGAVMAVQSSRIRQQARQITRERDRAEQVAVFLKDLFRISDPNVSSGADVTARELLEQGAQKIEQELQHQPVLQADMLQVIGEVYVNLGLLDQAEKLLERSLELRRESYANEHLDIADSMVALSSVLRFKGEYESAGTLLREALEMQERLVGLEHDVVAETLTQLAILMRFQGNSDSSELLHRRALAIRREVLGNEHQDVARSLSNLAILLKARGDLVHAEPLYREALAIQYRVLKPGNLDIQRTINNLAGLLRAKGEFAEAESLLRQVLEMRREVFDEHPDVAQSLNNLGTLFFSRGEYDPARSLYQEALAMWRKLLDEDHPEVANGLNNLAQAERARGDLGLAESLFGEALEIYRKRQGEESREVLRTLHALGDLMCEKGEYDRAEEYYRMLLSIRERISDGENPQIAQTLTDLGRCIIEQRRYPEAETLLLRAYTIVEQQRDTPGVCRTAEVLARLYTCWEREEEAAYYRSIAKMQQ